MISHGKNIKIFSGNSHPALAMQIASALGLPLGKATISTFSDGEISVSISESVRGSDVFLVQLSLIHIFFFYPLFHFALACALYSLPLEYRAFPCLGGCFGRYGIFTASSQHIYNLFTLFVRR